MELVNFYSFFPIDDPDDLGQRWYNLASSLQLRGTILVAPEGINLSLCGKPSALDSFLFQEVIQYTKLSTVKLRRSILEKPAFRKLRLKSKTEIITSNFELEPKNKIKQQDSYTKSNCSTYLEPDEFHHLAQQDGSILVDVRNDYEVAIGTFKSAFYFPQIEEFHNLPEFLSDLEAYRDSSLLTFCTGGVRCEKAVPLLQEAGFTAFQLHGGILHYLEKYGKSNENLWEGECFVFDDRVSVDLDMKAGSYQWCENCGQPSRMGYCVLCGKNEEG